MTVNTLAAAVAPTAPITPQMNSTPVAEGSYSNPVVSAAVTVPADHNNIVVAVDRTNLPNVSGDVLNVRIDHSADGGATWSPNPSGETNWPHGPFPVTFTVAGGVLKNPNNGNTITSSGVGIGFAAAPNQQFRITLTPLQLVQTSVGLSTANGPVTVSAVP